MKKLLFALLFLTLSAVLPVHAAAEYAVNSVLVNAESNTLTASLRTDGACVLMTALYGPGGRMLGVSTLSQSRTGGQNIQSVSENAFGCDLSEAVYGRAVLLRTGNCAPVSPRFDGVVLLGGGTGGGGGNGGGNGGGSSNGGGSGTGGGAALETHGTVVTIAADQSVQVHYLLAAYNSATLPTLLTAPFWDNTPTDGAPPPAAFPAYGSISTVLEAMAADLDSGDGSGSSVFDKYASQSYRDRVAAFLREATTGNGGIIGVGHDAAVSPGSPVSVDCGQFPMAERTWYVFAASARSVTGGGETFRAVYPIVRSSDAPDTPADNPTDNPSDSPSDTPTDTPSDSRTDLRMDTETYTDQNGNPQTRVLNTFSGQAVLAFNEDLYALDSSVSPPDLRQLDRGPAEASGRNDSRFRSIEEMMLIRSSGAVSLAVDERLVNQPLRVIVIRFDHAAAGEFLTLSADICDRYGNAHSLPLTITAAVERAEVLDHLDEDGNPVYRQVPVPTYRTSPDEWRGDAG